MWQGDFLLLVEVARGGCLFFFCDVGEGGGDGDEDDGGVEEPDEVSSACESVVVEAYA